MADDRLIPPSGSSGQGRSSLPAEQTGQAQTPAYQPESYSPVYEPEGSPIDWRRYVFAILRYKWLLALALVLGLAGAMIAWRVVEVRYTAEGNLWIEVPSGDNARDVGPIQARGLLEATSWVELLRSFAVLDSVVIAERLYLRAPDQFAAAFADFALAEEISSSGSFALQIAPNGEEYTLVSRVTGAGEVVERGRLGQPVGEALGFAWAPPAGSFPPEAEVPFSVLTPRDASRELAQQLTTLPDQRGNFIHLALEGTNPVRVASVLNFLMDRHVELAAELKRARLDETLKILEEQLSYTEAELASAERQLEEFRVQTISLPSDQAAISPGLQVTRNPVFNNFFEMRIVVDQVRRDHARLAAALRDLSETGEVRIEALQGIQAAAQSSELQRILDELVDARSQLRVLRDRYEDDYPIVESLLRQIRTIESQSIPRVLGGVLSALQAQERDLQARIDATAADLEAIPPRTIEEGRLERRVQITENLYNVLRSRVETARLAAASSIPDVRILDRAQVPQRSTNDTRLIIAAAIIFGFLGTAMGGAILLDRTDSHFRYAADVSRDIGLDILGSIPRIESGGAKRGVLNAAQALEAFRELRIHVGFAYGSAGPITLAISSPSQGEGKSLIASNLAVAFSEVGQRTLLIDGDTRRGDAHALFAREQSPGLVDYLKDRSGQEIIQKTDHENLDFIACGSRGLSTPELLASPRMAYFMGTLKRSYDVIIVDTPPLAAGGDALILSTLTGNLAVVIRTGTTEKQLAQVKLDQLSRLPIRVLGAILNDVDPSDGHHYYYSAYLPGYEPVPEDGEERKVQLISEAPTQAS